VENSQVGTRLSYLHVLWYRVLLRPAMSEIPLHPATTSRTCLKLIVMSQISWGQNSCANKNLSNR